MSFDPICLEFSPSTLVASPSLTSYSGKAAFQKNVPISNTIILPQDSNMLDTNGMCIDLRNTGYVNEEPSYGYHYSSTTGVQSYSEDHPSLDQFASKKIKKSNSTESSVPVQNTQTANSNSRKQKKKAKISEVDITIEDEISATGTDISLDNLTFDVKINSKKDSLNFEVNTNNLPECLQNIDIKESKNFSKTIG
eukprot:CAMPEP_0176467084 /NCGR_PEP_ID=MMETSP0127-20121128/38261_1 /TAXON_ID=938130 /ORGANISM="Platyophrya macrostoma, Strain WH" /LENGTH=194 /DNA_ID=CAMNT_0017860343 /DNA_START=34 /DNA_END=615 /DNA_ORIENTATION=+